MVICAREFFGTPESALSFKVEEAFYSALKMRNGTFKSTALGRFDDINPRITQFAVQSLPSTPRLLDVAVSTGVSAVELAQALEAVGLRPTVTATDLFLEGRIVDLGRRVRVLVDSLGWPLQYDVGGVSLRPWIRRLDYVTLAFLPRLAAQATFNARLRALAEAGSGRRVSLISQRLADYPGVRLVEDDVLVHRGEFLARFDLVRAANILNRSYFDRKQLVQAISNIRSYLSGNGSLLLVARSMQERKHNAASLFRLEADCRLAVVERFGKGSEIEDLVLEVAG